MVRYRSTTILLSVVVAVFVWQAHAQTDTTSALPNIVRFSGTLQNRTDAGVVGVTFSLYKDQQGGAPLWLEVQNVDADAQGRFTVSLGANHNGGVPLSLFTSGEAKWLGIQPEGLPEQERILLATVPYAAKAGDAETLGGKPLSAFVLATSTPATQTTSGTLLTSSARTFSIGVTPAATTAPVWVPNYLPKFLDASTLSNSTIVDTGGKIGIGTANPESLLDIVGNSGQMVRIGNVPWSFRIGSLQSGTQFIGIAVKKSAANNNYVATSSDIATVNHTVMEFNYDGSWRIKQQAHQADGTILNLGTSLSLTSAGNFGVGVFTPAQKMEVNGNLKINGTGNGIMFPDGSLLKTGAPVLTGVTAGTGILGGGSTGSPTVSLDTQFTDKRYAGLAAANTFTADQTFTNNVIVNGAIASGTHDVTGSLKLHGVGNGILFPDGTSLTSAAPQNAQPALIAADGIVIGGSQSAPIIGLNTAFTDARYASTGAATNVFAGDQIFSKTVSVSGVLSSGPHTVTGNVSVSGTVAGHSPSSVSGGIGVSAVADSEDGTALDVVESGVTGATTGVHVTVNSPNAYAGIFDNIAGGNILLGRIKIGDYWVRRFRVDGNGRVYANNGYATGGADFAESFAVAGGKESYEAGDVLVIDTTATRRLTRTGQPYSTLVAGVYSTRPGVIASPYDMDNEENLKKEVPLAVVGVVPCKVSAENGPIAVGDLLVTASLPGYAMRGTDRNRMIGAVVGKALQSMDSGTGIIQVLVSLQ